MKNQAHFQVFTRVRVMQLNDGHTFVTPDQIQEEFGKILELIMEMYRDFGIDDYSFRLSYRDPEDTEKYFPRRCICGKNHNVCLKQPWMI